MAKFNPFEDKPATSKVQQNVAPAFNIQLYDYLQSGNSINFVQARELGIDQLDRHIEDLRKVIKVYAKPIRINQVKCFDYSLQPFE